MKVTVAIELAKQGTLHIQSESQGTLEKCLKEIMPDVNIVMENGHEQGEQLEALKRLSRNRSSAEQQFPGATPGTFFMFQKLEYLGLYFITVHQRIKKQKEMDMVQKCGIYPNHIIFIQNKDLNDMIDEDRTMQLFGYTSDRWGKTALKPIVVVCEDCGRPRVTSKHNHIINCADTCPSCAAFRRHSCILELPIQNHELKHLYESGVPMCHLAKKCGCASSTIRHRLAKMGCKIYDMRSDLRRKCVSARAQGISYDEWEGFANNSPYCPKFDDKCRASNREKYGNRCFLCDKMKDENGYNLSVHHVDMNKNQGCDGHAWKLVPLCGSCHATAHSNTWKSRIEYLLRHAW